MPVDDHDAGDGAGLGLEPLLGPRQGAIVDAITQRLATGVPLSDDDLSALGWLCAVLGLTLKDLGLEQPPITPPTPPRPEWRGYEQ